MWRASLGNVSIDLKAKSKTEITYLVAKWMDMLRTEYRLQMIIFWISSSGHWAAKPIDLTISYETGNE